jgi:hypothetical protein
MTAKPWQSLISAFNDESASADSLLANAAADYLVVVNQVFVFDKFKSEFVEVPNRFVTGREVLSDSGGFLENWEVVKDRYEIEQNQKILNRAIGIVNKAGSSARLLGCGTLDEGRKFFAVVHTGAISVRCSTGRDDFIDSYIVVMSSHDGSIPICYYNLDARRLTGTIYRVASTPDVDFSIRKRHTPSEADLDKQAVEVLQMRKEWSKYLGTSIRNLFRPSSSNYDNETLEKFWPVNSATTEKRREHAESVHDTIRKLIKSQHNQGCFGNCRWATFNGICEYIDFHRNVAEDEAAQQMFEVDNYSHRLKVDVFKWLST